MEITHRDLRRHSRSQQKPERTREPWCGDLLDYEEDLLSAFKRVERQHPPVLRGVCLGVGALNHEFHALTEQKGPTAKASKFAYQENVADM